jgi:GNAT superfamily N-acetyltransferase
MAGTHVRRVRADEWRTWKDLRLEMLQTAPDAFGTRFEDAVLEPDEFWQERTATLATDARSAMFVVDDADDGWRAGAGCALTDDEPLPWAFSVYTRPAFRGQRLQDGLMAAVMDFARTTGHTELSLWVVEDNLPARRTYERLGFRPNGRTAVMRESIREIQLTRSLL